MAQKDEYGIVLASDVQSSERSEGMENVIPEVAVYKHMFQVGLFESETDRCADITGMIVRYQGGIRRNYESPFEKTNPKPPDCYSIDGKQGSRDREAKVLCGERRAVYGTCVDCYFSKFGTANAWKNNPQDLGKGVQCSEYSLVFLMLESGFPAVLQVPPTSTRSINQGITTALQKISGAALHNLVWKFIGTGGGKQGNYMKVIPIRGASVEEVRNIKQARVEMDAWIQSFVEQFASGGTPGQKLAEQVEQEIPSEEV